VSKLFTHVAPQSMPAGVLVTVLVAAPVPVFVTVNEAVGGPGVALASLESALSPPRIGPPV
jgi:hypothetical protein